MPVLERLVHIPDPSIHLELDQDAADTAAEGELGISIRLGTIAAIGLGMGVPALRWFSRYMKARNGQDSPDQQAKPAAGAAA